MTDTDTIHVVVLKPVRHHRPGAIVVVNRDDSLWASKVAAGSAVYLDDVVDAALDKIVDDDVDGEEE